MRSYGCKGGTAHKRYGVRLVGGSTPAVARPSSAGMISGLLLDRRADSVTAPTCKAHS